MLGVVEAHLDELADQMSGEDPNFFPNCAWRLDSPQGSAVWLALVTLCRRLKAVGGTRTGTTAVLCAD
jgi:hypothetical protein